LKIVFALNFRVSQFIYRFVSKEKLHCGVLNVAFLFCCHTMEIYGRRLCLNIDITVDIPGFANTLWL